MGEGRDLNPDQLEILRIIPEGSRVLDLGCGDGSLLERLRAEKRCAIQGIDRDQKMVMRCFQRGIPCIMLDLDQGLSHIDDQSFDYVILGRTFQQIHRPVRLLKEMLRVGRRALISNLNLGHWRFRLRLAVSGRCPESDGELWYASANIHQGSHRDFVEMAVREGLPLGACHPLGSSLLARQFPGLFAELLVYELGQESSKS